MLAVVGVGDMPACGVYLISPPVVIHRPSPNVGGSVEEAARLELGFTVGLKLRVAVKRTRPRSCRVPSVAGWSPYSLFGRHGRHRCGCGGARGP